MLKKIMKMVSKFSGSSKKKYKTGYRKHSSSSKGRHRQSPYQGSRRYKRKGSHSSS